MKLHSRRWVSLLCALAVFAVAAGLAWAQGDDINEKQKELEHIKQEIQSHREQSKQLGSREKQELKKIQSIDKELDMSRQYIKKLAEQEDNYDEQIGQLRTQIGTREVILSEQEATLARRLREMYKQDPHYRWEVLLGARSMDDAVRRYQFMHLIAQQDAQMIGEYREGKRQMEAQSARLAESMQQVSELRTDREQEFASAQASKKERESTLQEIRSEKSKHVQAIADLQKAQAELQNLLDELQRRGTAEKDLPPSGEFASMKGRLIWPVSGKVIRTFGKHVHPKYGTVTMNNGVDISAAAGAPIVAVASGVVEFVDWIDAFGKCVILNHGGGYYTLYAHVADTNVSQGQKVGRGQAIAEVGDTGSLDGYVCHFEIRKARQALDPSDWLTRKPSS
ncbi:MAG TPA: peptidoglycan DD-metalloendopeptidase family protein [Candidatus Krumholzibacteria bacterium]|nr:peptidoglycan DD-metalloendopeptidase family protein [Candidatus Krumholzibacteria bacterium]